MWTKYTVSSYSSCLLWPPAEDCIWAPWRFVLHEHLPPSHMASIKPSITMAIQKSARLTGTVTSPELIWPEAHARHQQISKLPPTTHVPWYLPGMHASPGVRTFCRQCNPSMFLYYVLDHWSRWTPPCLCQCGISALCSQWWTDNSLTDRLLLKAL